MYMRAIIFFILLFFQTSLMGQLFCPIIPQPVKAAKVSESFQLSENTSLWVEDESLLPVAYYLQQQLLQQFHIPITIQKNGTSCIKLFLTKISANPEAYQLNMDAKEVQVSGADRKAVFYGVVSLMQLAYQSELSEDGLTINCWYIEDAPLYNWRGLMIDESRHFFGMDKIKSILDWMAFYKLNRLHWHLTDEPGWRIEIKKYPKLALVGGIGVYTNPNAPAQFYTQQQIADIVHYAAEKNIIVIPEIDMPGHATAANRAYPDFSGGGSDAHPDFTFHPGKEETYQYLTHILRETNTVFHAGMLHLGGDEVSYGNDKWINDNDVKGFMLRNKLTTVHQVEQYFMQRMADSVFKMNAKLLAWDEIADMNFPPDKTIVFWWRHDKPEQLQIALDKGYATVLCPRLPFYFDFVQDSTQSVGRKWGKLYNPLENVYNFNADSLSVVKSNSKKHILGIQANLWTETIPNTNRLDFMLFPRMAALAETAWSPPNKKDYASFSKILKKHFSLYEKQGINYFNPFKK